MASLIAVEDIYLAKRFYRRVADMPFMCRFLTVDLGGDMAFANCRSDLEHVGFQVTGSRLARELFQDPGVTGFP
ncbi:hypothetical protein D3C76_835750 [compost metagenome]